MFSKILMPKEKPTVKILSVIELKSPYKNNSRHRWCEAEVNGILFKVRKPIGVIKSLLKN